MAEWTVAIVERYLSQLPRLGNDLCNAWFMAPSFHEQISVGFSALFLLLALTWLYNLLFLGRNVSIDSQELGGKKTTSNSTNTRSVDAVRLIATCTGALTYAAAAAWENFHPVNSAAGVTSDGLLLFFLAQSLTWLAFAAVCILEIRQARVVSSPAARGVARAWWTITFLLAATETTTLVIRLLGNCPSSYATRLDAGRVALAAGTVNLVASLALVVTAFLESSRKIANEERSAHLNGDAEEPLLRTEKQIDHTHGYAGASRLSRLTWQWMNPLLQKGYNARLEVADVPTLALRDDAQNLYERYEENWRNSEGQTHNRVRTTVMWSFQREFLQTGALALCRACVMYIGPALITKFVDFKAGQNSNAGLWRGFMLVFVLVVAKSLDVSASHHFNFQCTNLGMAIRSTLITVVYRKGIRLTNAARLVHGVGQIVNYMSVDVQMLADVILQVHNLWLLPIQVGIALTILYSVVGWSMLAGFMTMVGIVCLSTWSSRVQRKYQGFIMKAKDERMKATSEALTAMKVIKLQAWETHFQDRIEKLRDQEYHWILQFMYQVLSTTTFIWCAPTIVSVVTFSCCVLLEGTELTPGQVFTAVATFRILQEPIRNFPQTLIAVSQAQVSLDRLEKYLRSEELDTNAVERSSINEGDESLAVSVRSASFSWTEPDGNHENSSTTSSLHDIDLEVKKGALVAVVGTVGSGKSSLLACMLGEMPKLQGKVTIPASDQHMEIRSRSQ